MRKITLLFLFLLICVLPILALAEPQPPALDAEGFLEAGAEPYVYQDRAKGRWMYVDDQLSVDITRREDAAARATWFETIVKTRGEERMTSLISSVHGKKPGKSFQTPTSLLQEQAAVLAFTDDLVWRRLEKGQTPGIILRNGEILARKSYRNGSKTFPALEIIALLEDGGLKTYDSAELMAGDYRDMGVTDTYGYGPILLREGEYGPWVLDEEYEILGEPRTVLGMVEPGYYVVLTVMGDGIDTPGYELQWLADRMLDQGVTEALNLGGGNSAFLCFMGEVINYDADFPEGNLREIGGMIAFGAAQGEEGEE